METILATEASAYKEYVLTDRGQKLLPVIVALGQWAESDAVGVKLVDVKRSQSVRLEFLSNNGRRVDLNDAQIVADER